MLSALRIPAILILMAIIVSAFGKGGIAMAFLMPAAVGVYILIISDKKGQSIDDFFALLFGVIIVGSIIIGLSKLLKLIF